MVGLIQIYGGKIFRFGKPMECGMDIGHWDLLYHNAFIQYSEIHDSTISPRRLGNQEHGDRIIGK
jgi:hypothetical protein